jgi:membrane associated rhomboid family serine protease
MLIPIGQENDTVRRVPWVTIVIMGLCVIIHIFNAGAISEFEERLFGIYSEIYDYYTAHPYLRLDEELKKTFNITEQVEEVLKSMSGDKYSPGLDEAQKEEEQDHLDKLVEELKSTKERLPFYKYGLVPNKKTFVGFIGHMFLHAGWLHLLGNLFYLYLMGPFIEDVWGKPAYAVFYLVVGMLAAFVFTLHYPNSDVPMIGASGAISGVMGGFMIRYWHARIRYFYMFSILVRGTFSAPAWVMLPMGFIMDLISARLMDSIAPGGGGGVAHWVHVWGFVFGAAGGLAIKFLKIEQKFVAPKVEAQTTYVNKSFVLYEEAMQVQAGGDKEKAYAILMDAAKEDSSNQDVIEALWNIAPGIGRTGEVVPLLTRLIEREIQKGRVEAASIHYRQFRDKAPGARFSPHTKIKIFDQAIDARDSQEANSLFKELMKEINLASPPGLVMDFCLAALKYDLDFGQSFASKVVELALQHPEIPGSRKESLKHQLNVVSKQKREDSIKADSHNDYNFSQPDSNFVVPPVPTAPKTPLSPQKPTIPMISYQAQPPPPPIVPIIPIKPNKSTIPIQPGKPVPSVLPEPLADELFISTPPPVPRKILRVTKAVPLGIKEGKIALNVENMGERIFALEKIKWIAVVKISPPGERPFLLIDLLVDDPSAPAAPTVRETVIRTLRLSSTQFNPQKLVAGAQAPLEAFKIFTSGLLNLSKAKSFPDMESVRLKKIAVYRSLDEYENSLLNA